MPLTSKPDPGEAKRAARRAETLGLLLLSLLALIITIIRYWGHIPWTVR